MREKYDTSMKAYNKITDSELYKIYHRYTTSGSGYKIHKAFCLRILALTLEGVWDVSKKKSSSEINLSNYRIFIDLKLIKNLY
jgi:hypothetical protein